MIVNGRNVESYKFMVGQIVKVRDDLRIGLEYVSEDGSTSNYMTPDMLEYRGKKAEIIGRKHGQYILNIDRYSLYTDSMLVDTVSAEEEEFAKADYVFNEDVEKLISKLMKYQQEQAIDRALDSKMHETDPEAFQQLVDLKF